MGRPEGCCQSRCLHNKVTHTLASQAKQSYCSLWTSPKIGCTPSCFFVGIRLPDHAVLQFCFPGRFVLTSPVVFAKIFERLGKERRTALLSVQILIWSGIEVVITGLTRNQVSCCPFCPAKTLQPCGFYPVRKLNKFAVLSVSSFQSLFHRKKARKNGG